MAASNRVVRSPFREQSGFLFPDYTQEVIESTFGRYFTVQRSVNLGDSERTLYLMSRR